MDAFKSTEIKRMQSGGNKAWQDFFNSHPSKTQDFEDCSIQERYDSEAGEEYKERLTAKCEDREFDAAKFKEERARILAKQKEKEASRSGTPMGRAAQSNSNSRTQSPAPAKGMMDPEQKARNEEYFQRMGNANAGRSDNLPPSQGGKYGGFGSNVEPRPQQAGIPSADEFQKDPMAALTKGFGWFSSTVSKQAKMVNESYIQPTARNIAQTDFAAQAQKGLATVSTGVASGARGATEQFHKFVEGQDQAAASAAGKREPERKDFWDSFGVADEKPQASKPSSIGTSAMRKTNSNTNDAGAKKKKDDGWGDDW